MQISDYICIGLCACNCILGRSKLLISCYLNTLVWVRTLWLKKSSTEWSQEKGGKQWFSKCDPWTSSLSTNWVFVQTTNSRTLPTYYIRNSGQGPAIDIWASLLSDSDSDVNSSLRTIALRVYKKIQSWSQSYQD